MNTIYKSALKYNSVSSSQSLMYLEHNLSEHHTKHKHNMITNRHPYSKIQFEEKNRETLHVLNISKYRGGKGREARKEFSYID